MVASVASQPVLRVEGLGLRFGGIKALDHVTFEVKHGEILGIIGPNGAGKTSVLNCISGFYKPQEGEIFFENNRITRLRPDLVAHTGIGRTFQNTQLYTGLTTLENLMAARHSHCKYSWLESCLYFGRSYREEIRNRRAVEDIIDLLNLQRYRKTGVEFLSYGLRKRIDLGRALAQEPKLLLLDEPMAGVDATEKRTMARFILDVKEEKDMTLVFIEHDMSVIMDISDRILVLDFGQKIAEGSPEQVRRDPQVMKAYLGEQVSI